MRLTWEMFERFGLTAQCLGCRAIRTGIGYPANHTERCRERIEQELEKEPEGTSKVARDGTRIKRARHEERARDLRIEEPDQRPDLEVIEGTGASSSRDGAGNEPPPRPAESSVSVDQPPREQSDDADMGDPESDRRRPRESVVEERETKRVRINVFDGEESDEWVETEEERVRIHCRPRRDLFSLHDSQGGPKLSDISRRRESIVCSTDGGEWRIVDRWDEKGSENHEPPQDLPQEWTGSTRFRKSWRVLCDYESENQKHSKTCSSDIEQMQPPAGDDLSLDENCGIFDLRPKSQQGKRWNLGDRKDQREILWLIRKKRPKLVIGCGKCILFCTVLYHEQIRRGAWFLHDLSGDASQLSLPCMIRLECRHDVFHALGDARDRRDGERVSFLTNSPHIARRVEGSKRREDLDSEICEGLRQQVDDAGHTSSTMHIASGTQVRPFDLTPQILKKRSRRSEGGQILQELNSIREGEVLG